MATAAHRDPLVPQKHSLVERWFFVWMAFLMIAISVAGFMPAIVHSATRRAPLSLLAAIHGIVFFTWQLLYLAQSSLVAAHRAAWHRRLGAASFVLLALMIVLGFTTTTAMVRRGFDLSGDQHVDPHPAAGVSLDAPTASVFNFAALLTFSVLAIAAIGYRRRPQVHKRLMLFANIALMSAPFAHLVGHIPQLGQTPTAFLLPYALLLLTAVGRDYLLERRVRLLTAALAIGMFVAMPIQALAIGPSAAWHWFAIRLSQ
jgi:hypothetical protein